MPNWVIHNKWTDKVGIDRLIANFVDRNIDYGTEWAFDCKIKKLFNDDDTIILRQLKFFHYKDLEKKYSKENLYIKAFYLHHLLDFFMETRINIYDIQRVFQEFLERKVVIEFTDINEKTINFQKELNEIFDLLMKNKEELFIDLRGNSKK
ncbi:MAG: hypothetical protein ACFFBH_07030 [Promethearchaeota archaeon]